MVSFTMVLGGKKQDAYNKMLRIIKDTMWIMGVATVLALAAYLFRTGMTPIPGSTSSPSITASQSESSLSEDDLKYQSIDFETARKMFEEGTALFADARSLEAFRMGRVPGAIHLDPEEMEQWSETIMVNYPPDQVIITYCHGAQCDLSQLLAEKLIWLGFEKVYYMTDGWGRWLQAGLPIE